MGRRTGITLLHYLIYLLLLSLTIWSNVGILSDNVNTKLYTINIQKCQHLEIHTSTSRFYIWSSFLEERSKSFERFDKTTVSASE